MDNKLNSKDSLTSLLISKGIFTWEELIQVIKKLPYGRNSNRKDLSLVISEGKGSCSSKHAFLKKIADLNNIAGIKLILGIYKMNEINTPGIGTILSDNNINFIPEAHCYLKINNKRKDITTENSDFKELSKDIIEEIEITPEQVVEFKVNYHQEFLKNWIKKNSISYSFNELWSMREKCIENLGRL